MILEIYFTRPRHLHIGATRRKELILLNFISQICQDLLQFRMSSSSNKRGHKKHLYVPKQYELMPPIFGHKMAREIAVRISKQDKIKFTAKKNKVCLCLNENRLFPVFFIGDNCSASKSEVIWRFFHNYLKKFLQENFSFNVFLE